MPDTTRCNAKSHLERMAVNNSVTPRQLLADKAYRQIFETDWDAWVMDKAREQTAQLSAAADVMLTPNIEKMDPEEADAIARAKGFENFGAVRIRLMLWQSGLAHDWGQEKGSVWRQDAMKKSQRLYAHRCTHSWKPEDYGGTGKCERNLGGEAIVLLQAYDGHGKRPVCLECARERPTLATGAPSYLMRPGAQCANCDREFWMRDVARSRMSTKYWRWEDDPEDEHCTRQVRVVFCCEYCRRNYVSLQSRTRPDPVECPVCHETFEPQRKSAKYCGPTCRQRAKRLRDALDKPTA